MWASAPTAVGRSTSVERGWSCVARHIRRIDPCIWSGQRQRRGRRDDPTFHAPCKIHQPCGTHPNNLKRAGRAKGFLNRRFKRRFLHTFCRCWQKCAPPEASKAASPTGVRRKTEPHLSSHQSYPYTYTRFRRCSPSARRGCRRGEGQTRAPSPRRLRA